MTEKYAFPCGTEHLAEPVTAGMTLRDYFAAKALQRFIGTGTEGGMLYDQVAEVAYLYADAMLKAREQ